MSSSEREMLDVAAKAARRAAEIHREVAAEGFSITEKKSRNDRVTDADIRAEAAIVEIVRGHYPDHNIIAEEGRYAETSSPYRWIIDPLDGTLNFSRGLPVHSVSIAVARGDSTIVGVVRDSFREEMFAAIRGGGAFLNDQRIWASSVERLEDALLINGFFYQNAEATSVNLAAVERFFARGVLSVRQFGSAALDMCYVACGRADGFWERALQPWDFAAAALILAEAGGTVTDAGGSAVRLAAGSIIASNGRIHEYLVDTLRAPQSGGQH